MPPKWPFKYILMGNYDQAKGFQGTVPNFETKPHKHPNKRSKERRIPPLDSPCERFELQYMLKCLTAIIVAKLSFKRRRTTCSSVRIVGGRTLWHDLDRGHTKIECLQHAPRPCEMWLPNITHHAVTGFKWNCTENHRFWQKWPCKAPFSSFFPFPRRCWEVRRLSQLGRSYCDFLSWALK